MAGLIPSDYDGAVPVDGYGPGFFRVAGTVHHGPVLVDGTGRKDWQGLDDLAPLLALSGMVDVLFLGMGTELRYPPKAMSAALEAIGITIEPMTTSSAARSYNVTLSEGRRVACALLPI